MRRLLLLATLALVLAWAGSALAITGGEPDAGAHPYVGLVGFYDADGVYVQRCSGTLIAPTVVLTAAHCAYADDGTLLADAQAWFDDVVGPGVVSSRTGGTPGVAIPHPGFDGYASLPDSHDVAVVRLDAPVPGARTAVLAPVGELDRLAASAKKKDVALTLVGYGFLQVRPTEVTGDRTRMQGTVRMGRLQGGKTASFDLLTSRSPKRAGFCFGDSGGPVLVGDSNAVVAVSSLLQGEGCTSTSLSYRVDTPEVQAWLARVAG